MQLTHSNVNCGAWFRVCGYCRQNTFCPSCGRCTNPKCRVKGEIWSLKPKRYARYNLREGEAQMWPLQIPRGASGELYSKPANPNVEIIGKGGRHTRNKGRIIRRAA